MKKTLLKLAVISSICLFVTACSSGETKTTQNNTTNVKDSFKIGVVQFIQHPALDNATKGFIAALDESGIKYSLDMNNANGEISSAQTIADKVVGDKDDLIFAGGTPAAQAVAGVTKDIPIVYTAVTDPKSAGLSDNGATNITGTSDLTPVKEQIELLHKLLPEAKTVGVLYSSAEANSTFQVNLAKEACKDLGLSCKEYSVSSFNEIQSIVESMISKVDAIYVPTDNMIVAGISTVTMIANENKIPVIGSEQGQVDQGALATYAIDYFKLGELSGNQAVEILKDNKKPSDIPVAYLDKSSFKVFVNKDTAKLLNVNTDNIDNVK